MDRRSLLSLAGIGLGTAGAGCLSGVGGMGRAFDIGMSANAFRPDSFTVSVGEAVTWVNDGSRAHTVTAYDAGIPDGASFFASGDHPDEAAARAAWTEREVGIIHPSEQYVHTFEVSGRYVYFCIPHEARGMVGELLVE